MVVCDNDGIAISNVRHIIDTTNNVAAKLLPGQEAAACILRLNKTLQFVKSVRAGSY
ncbi:MAG: hypothetical protein M3275_14295 [Thermoproteota archaeon]|nr:hypothetical protein [Thermoproteota archaeon]